MQHVRRIPPGLLVGLALAFVSVAADVLVTRSRPVEWSLVCDAGLIASMCIAASGALELARRLAETRARAAQVAALGFGVVAAQRIWDLFMRYSNPGFKLPPELLTVGLVLAGIGLGLAAGRVLFAAGLAIVAFGAVPPPQLQPSMGNDMAMVVGVSWLCWTVIALRTLQVAVADAAEAPERRDLAVSGLRRASVALWIRLGAASLLVSAVYIPQIRYGTSVIGATVGAVSMVMVASGLVRVATGGGKELPRIWAYVAAFLGLWSAVVWSHEALLTYKRMPTAMPNWTQAPQYIGAAAILVLLVCIYRLATNSGDEKLQSNAKTAMTLFVLLTLISLPLISLGGFDMKSMGKVYALSFGTTFGIGALVVAAATCTKAAAALDARPGLATATLRDGPS